MPMSEQKEEQEVHIGTYIKRTRKSVFCSSACFRYGNYGSKM